MGITDPLSVFQISTAWSRPEDDLRMTAWSKSLIEHMNSLNKAKALSSEFLYIEDAGEFQDPFAGFPVENVQKMKAIRSTYDTDKVFQQLNWGGFKMGF